MGGIFYTDEGSSSERDLISIGERVSMGGIPPLIYNSPSGSINITLGLPLIRTSVDHGTALPLAGSGSIDTGSLQVALLQAQQLISSSRH